MGANANIFNLSCQEILQFSISAMLTNKVSGFAFKSLPL